MQAHTLIFDCDGVLVDSEPIACGAVAVGLQRLSLPVSTEEILDRYTGISGPAMYADLELRYETSITQTERDQISAFVEQELSEKVTAMPGVAPVLDALIGSHAMCVASSSSQSRIATSLKRAGLFNYFENCIFSAFEVKSGKPAPDLFLFAAARMGANPKRCIVIEDSTAGVRAASAAGMRCIGFAGGGHANQTLSDALLSLGAQPVIDRMDQLASAISSAAEI